MERKGKVVGSNCAALNSSGSLVEASSIDASGKAEAQSREFSRAIRMFAVILIMSSCALVLVRGFLSENGYLSHDSTAYLQAAQRIVSDGSAKVPNSGSGTAGLTHFAVWPLGYPAMIAAASHVTGLEVFAASKVLNCFLFLGSALILSRALRGNGLVLALTLCFSGTTALFSYTWSEAPFVFFLICFSLVLARVIQSPGKLATSDLMQLLTYGVLLFFVRYIGAFSACVVLVASARAAYLGHKASAVKLCGVAFSIIALVFIYLGFNWLETGHSTGMPRVPAPESSWELSRSLFASLVREAVIPVCGFSPNSWKQLVLAIAFLPFIVVLVLSLAKQWRVVLSRLLQSPQATSFLVVGIFYLSSVIAVRWMSHFDGFGFRLLNPGMVLLWLGVLGIANECGAFLRRVSNLLLLVGAAFSVAVGLYSLAFGRSDTHYGEKVAHLIKKYESVPDGAIVIFGHDHLRYLRPDVHLSSPKYQPYFLSDESWSEFVGRLDRTRDIYVDIGGRSNMPGRYHDSVKEFVAKNQGRSLFRLN